VRTPRFTGKVERSHRTDKQEFYQLLTYTGDVDLNRKLAEWQNFYNYHRPQSALKGKTRYELLLEKMNMNLAEAKVECLSRQPWCYTLQSSRGRDKSFFEPHVACCNCAR
jgi:transposase InsO family protein